MLLLRLEGSFVAMRMEGRLFEYYDLPVVFVCTLFVATVVSWNEERRRRSSVLCVSMMMLLL